MPEELTDTLHQLSEKRYETQVVLLLSLVFLALSMTCITLSELGWTALGRSAQAETFSFPLPLGFIALGAMLGFLACYALTDKLKAPETLFSTFPLALIALGVGYALGLANLPIAALFSSFALVFLFMQWIRLSKPVASHSYFVISLATAFVISGALCCFCGISLPSDYHLLQTMALCFALVSCFFNYLFFHRFRRSLEELPSKKESSFRSLTLSTTFHPALIDGFLLGLCLRYLYEGASLGLPIGASVGFAVVLSTCLNCLQLIPRSNYEKFTRNHASSLKLIPLLLPILFGHEYLLITAGISLFVTLTYAILLLTSLSDRVLLLEISPFFTYGTHGTIFFFCMIVGIFAMPIFSLIHIDAPLWCLLVLLAVVIGTEWLLVETIGRKSYIDPESNKISTWEKISQENEPSKTDGTDASEEAHNLPASQRKKEQEQFAPNGPYPEVPSFTKKDSNDQADGSGSANSASRWSNHIRKTAEMYGLSARQEEVLFLLAKGRTAQFIADKLVITLATAKSHIYNIYIKFGVHSQQELLDLLESEEEK